MKRVSLGLCATTSLMLIGCSGSSNPVQPADDAPDPNNPIIEQPGITPTPDTPVIGQPGNNPTPSTPILEQPGTNPTPDIPTNQTPDNIPVDGAFDQADRSQFTNVLTNAWIDSTCEPIDASDDGFASYKIVKTFSESEYIYNVLAYVNDDCTGISYADWYPSIVESWSLGEFITLTDGTGAWEFDSQVTQPGGFDGSPGPDVGTPNFDFATIREGRLFFGDRFADMPENRPTALEPTYFEPRLSTTGASLDASMLQGNWFSGCVFGVESTFIFNPDTIIIENENWNNEDCEGESYQVRRTTFDVTYGDQFFSRDGDTMLAYDITALSNETLKYDASQGVEARNFQVPVGTTEYRSTSLHDGDTLIAGYCLYVDTENDDCQNSADRRPDMVDYNWLYRFTRQ